MKKSLFKFKKFNRTVLQKKTPLLNFTVLELFVLWVVVVSGVSAIAVRSQLLSTSAKDTTTRQSAAKETKSTDDTSAQHRQPATATQQNNPQPQNNGTAATSSLPDQYGCTPQTPGYADCEKYAKQNALTLWCDDQASKAGNTYYSASKRAQAAYDAVMAEWNAVKDQPYYTHSPYDEYATDAKTKYNAIEKPAYETYANTINSLNARGCHEILAYSDTSWAGY